MKVLVCGSRTYNNESRVRARLSQLPKGTMIIEGCARGADTIAGRFADDYGYPHIRVAANWEVYGKAAGIRRNEWMLDLEPDLVIAFTPGIKSSKGTSHCIYEARKRDIPVEVIT